MTWLNACSNAAGEVWNMYGPTETTIWSSATRVHHGQGAVRASAHPSPTRSSMSWTRACSPAPSASRVSCSSAGPASPAATGIREELTAARFIANPFAATVNRPRLYATGDLARRHDDGTGRAPRPRRLPGQGARLSHRAYGDRSRPAWRTAAGLAKPSSRSPGRTPRVSPGWSPTSPPAPPARLKTAMSRNISSATLRTLLSAHAARLHDAQRLRGARRDAPQHQRQDRPRRPAQRGQPSSGRRALHPPLEHFYVAHRRHRASAD